MYITREELIGAAKQILASRQSVPFYKFISRYQMLVMADTLLGVVDWLDASGSAQRNCGCSKHTNHFTN